MRLLRHLSFSNVIAMLALFVALGGAAYAGTTISGSSIKNGSIGGGKLKNETITAGKLKKGTITGAQIASGSISSSSIDLSTLGTVPSAQTANTAGTATKAGSATTATTAETAKSAESAENAKHAETADSATHADVADQAIHAENSDTATYADTAGEAETLDGKTGEELTLSCKSGTEFYGGMCWDGTMQGPKLWPVAAHECGEAGGRLPSIEELIAFVLRDGSQFSGEAWSGDLDSIETNPPSKVEVVFTTDEIGLARTRSAAATLLGYRCVFPQSNSVE
ncbi:MAG: hypothetical protein ACRDPE_18485 [Solirubrobacterales bacterium]